MDKLLEKRVKELGYKGCRNCKFQIASLRTCEWQESGGDGVLHLICPRWEKKMPTKFDLICGYPIDKVVEIVDEYKHNRLIPVDYIWDRAEFYEKQWLEDDNHWCKNVAEALRALLEDWDGEVGGGTLGDYE